jgi:hypothetical protein
MKNPFGEISVYSHINPLSKRRSENGTNIINRRNLVLAAGATAFGHFAVFNQFI